MTTPRMSSPTPSSVASPLTVRSATLVRAIFCMVGGAASFACMNAIAKFLTESLPVMEVAFARLVVNLVLLIPWMVARKISFLGTRRTLLASRSLTGTIALAFNFGAAAALPLADLGALLRCGVLFTVALSAVVLKEKVSRGRWGLVVVGFLGVLLILKPTFAVDSLGGLQGVLAAFFGSLSAIAIRELRDTEHPCTVIFQFGLYGSLAIGALFGGSFVLPHGTQWLLLIACGVVGSLGQILVTSALHSAPASLVAPYSFAEVVFMALIGVAVFGEAVSLTTLIGTLIIVSVGIVLARGAMKEHRLSASVSTGGNSTQSTTL